MSRVIYADFVPREAPAIRIASEVLYADDHVVLVRFRCGFGDDVLTTHFLAHRRNVRVELVPVDA
jgi:hypothetical protein